MRRVLHVRCIYCGFCIDACPEEAIIMSREHHQSVYNRSETIYNIEKLMQRPGIDAKGMGYRPNKPQLAEAKIFNKDEQKSCAFPMLSSILLFWLLPIDLSCDLNSTAASKTGSPNVLSFNRL